MVFLGVTLTSSFSSGYFQGNQISDSEKKYSETHILLILVFKCFAIYVISLTSCCTLLKHTADFIEGAYISVFLYIIELVHNNREQFCTYPKMRKLRESPECH